MITLFYEGYTNPNGAATFVEHLYNMLRMADYHEIEVCNVRKVHGCHKLARGSNIDVHSITLEEAHEKAMENYCLITQLPFDGIRIDWYRELLKYKLPFTLHGGVKKKDGIYPWAIAAAKTNGNPIVTFRDAETMAIDNCRVVQIGHPYIRKYNDFLCGGDYFAIAIGRVSSEKRTDIVCEANVKLSEAQRIKIFGEITGRIYAYRKLDKTFPNWRDNWMDSPHKSNITTAELCRRALYALDLTEFDWTGGGTQYVTLEAMDAGTQVIVNRAWLEFDGEMEENVNCFAVSCVEELVELLQFGIDINIVDNYEDVLYRHSSEVVLEPFLDVIYGEV